MAKKTIDKDTKTTKVKNVETKNDVSNKKEDEIVNLEATDISEDKNDVSEVITHDNVSENVEKMDIPENVDLIEKTEATADMLNEETVEKNESENVEDEYSDDDDSLDVADYGSIPTYVACPPEKNKYVSPRVAKTYKAQCPPKTETSANNSYVAQKPY